MRAFCLAAVTCLVAGCGDNVTGLDNYFPSLPPATGEVQRAFAGQVTDASQLVKGPAQSGMIGDFFIKNDRVTFIVEAATRVIGVIPQGGNLIDAVLTDGTTQVVDDHFGELAMLYRLGRTCEPDRLEIVRDGSSGGIAALRAIGKSGNDDFLNLKGVQAIRVDPSVNPDIDDGVECATTYVLAPGSTTLEVYHSLYNASPDRVSGPLGTIADTGGNTEAWTGSRGFDRVDVSSLLTLGPTPTDYVVYQGPGVAYGIVPHHDQPTAHTQALIAGVSIVLDGTDDFVSFLDRTKDYLHLDSGAGLLQRYDLVVGRDGSDIDAAWRAGNSETLQAITGHVTYDDGTPASGARVGFFLDGNGNGQLDDSSVDLDGDRVPDDRALTYADVADDGSYHAQLPAGMSVVVRAEVKDVGRSAAAPLQPTLDLAIPAPIKVDYQILDANTGLPIPGRLVAIGDHPAFPDARLFEIYDRGRGTVDTAGKYVVSSLHAIRGTTTDLGDGSDPALYLPGGGTYRVYVSRGTEWSIDSQPVTASGEQVFHLKQVVPTSGYYATDWHVHQVGSPDSPVLSEERIRSAVSAGVEMFAVTDHDYVSDLQPLVEQMHLERLLRVVPGIEVTPFAYGHFNGWPLVPDDTSPNRGAIDWARGAALGQAMTPGEVFGAMRTRGARMVQVNHPRALGFSEFQAAFSVANVKYDYAQRTIYGDYMDAIIPNEDLRLPGESLWSDSFNGLEIWNGFTVADSNGDGVRENKNLDRVMRDWLSMLSLGFFVTPAGDSDTHTTVSDPLGMPRTYVRVADDSPDALASGAAVEDVVMTQTGAASRPRDVVITDGPMISVTSNGAPALGTVVSAINTPATLIATVISPDWAEVDTLEIFGNSTPDPVDTSDNTVLVPLVCYTSRPLASLDPKDPCMQAPLAPRAMTVTLANLGGGFHRYEATVTVTLDASDIASRAGATGQDAWLVFRARGDRAVFPLLTKGDTISDVTLPALLTGDMPTIATALAGRGIPAEAVTSPVFVDFDGNGYRAPFAP